MQTPELRIILSARLAVSPAGAFSVDIDDSATPLPEEETFRFALQYCARVLYELARTQRSVRGVPLWIAALSESSLDADTDVFRIADVEGSLVKSVRDPVAEVELTMKTNGIRHRIVEGDLTPLRGAMLARSVLAVCQAVLPRLSPAMRDAVPVALANMNESYEMTHRYADPASLHEVPDLAYLAASFA